MTTQRKKTYQEGAKDERKAWVGAVNRLRKWVEKNPYLDLDVLEAMRKFGANRAKRYNTKPGGLGKN